MNRKRLAQFAGNQGQILTAHALLMLVIMLCLALGAWTP